MFKVNKEIKEVLEDKKNPLFLFLWELIFNFVPKINLSELDMDALSISLIASRPTIFYDEEDNELLLHLYLVEEKGQGEETQTLIVIYE